MAKRYAIIVAGGSGTRFGAELPKQFVCLKGKPILMHTIQRFVDGGCDAVMVVLPQSQHSFWTSLCHEHGFLTPHLVCAGGDSRYQSVKNGIQALAPERDALVAVHDGVRPLVSNALINRCFEVALSQGSAIPAVPVTDSVRQFTDESRGTSRALNRASLRAVQTPQTFRADIILDAYNLPFSPEFTDDASVSESAGFNISLVEGDPENIKITHPIDLAIAEMILK